MGRSLKKGPFVSQKLLAKIDAQLESGDRKPIKTWSRASMITPDFVGLTFLVHTGKAFATVYVTENMVGRVIFYTVSQMPGCDIADIKIAVTVAVEYYRRFYILGGIVDRQLFAADGQQLDIADGSIFIQGCKGDFVVGPEFGGNAIFFAGKFRAFIEGVPHA